MTFALCQASVGFKRILPSVVFLTLLSLFALPLSQSEATSFTTGLVGHWKFDETSGTTAVDSSGNGNNGTLMNGPTISTDYAPTIFQNTRALSFDGTDDYVSISDMHSSIPGEWSVCTWFKAAGFEVDDKVFHTQGGTEINITFNHADSFDIYTTGAGVYTHPATTGRWYQVCVVRDSSTRKVYVDGSLANSAADTTAWPTSEVWIGGRVNNEPANTRFNGLVDEFRVYNRALSAEEISVLAAEKSLVGYWKFDETSGTSATDSSGMGNTGTLTNGPTISTDVPDPINFTNARSLSFDGTDDYVNIPTSTSLSPTEAITVGAWIKRNRTGQREIFLGKGNGVGPSTTSYWLEVDSSDNIAFLLSQNGTVDRKLITTSSQILDTSWHHVMGTWDGLTQKLYLDGILDSTTEAWTGTIGTNSQPFAVGWLPDQGTLRFQGKVDDVRIYNRALSAEEIDDLADGDHPGTTWTGEHSIYYEDPNNWNTGVVPAPYSNVTIANAGARPILTDDVSLSDLTIDSNASLDLKDKDLTMLDNGEFLNDGSLILDGSQTMTDFENESAFGEVIIRGSSNLSSFPTGANYNDLRIEDPTENGLVGYWKLDEGSGSLVTDLSGNGYDGTLVNGPTFSTSVGSTNFHNPRSLSFDGVNDYASVSGSYPTGTSSRSLCSWIKSADGIKNGNADHILNYGDIDTAEAFGIMIYTGNRYWFYGHGGAMDMDTGITADTNWHHHCVTYDGATVRYYIDGASVASGSRTLATAAGNLRMAIRMDETDDNNFDGSLDDVRIYNRALSANEVMNLARGRYAAGSVSTATHLPDTSITVNGTLSLDSGNLNAHDGGTFENDVSLLRGNGSLILSSSVFFNQNLTLSGGTLNGGDADVTVEGNVSVLTGSLLAPSGQLTLRGDFSKTGGSFSHGLGELQIDGSPTSIRSGGASFWMVNAFSNTVIQDAFVADTLNVLGGNFQQGSNSVTTNAMTVNGGTFTGAAGRLDVNRSLSIADGTFTAPSGLMTLSGSLSESIDGVFAHNNGRVILDSTSPASIAVAEPLNDLYVNDGMLGYWNFDETSGTSAADSSGYGNTGTHTNSPTISTSVPDVNFANARSLSFDGTNDYVSVGDAGDTSTSVTLSTWVKLDAISNSLMTILAKRDGSNNTNWALRKGQTCGCAPGGNDDELTFYQNSGGFKIYHTTNANLSADTWYHIAVTYDGTTDPKIYKNGILLSGGWAAGFVGPASLVTNDGDATIGALNSGSEPLDGSLDDVRIYNRALSAGEVALLAAGNQPATSLATTTLGAALDVNGDLSLNAGTLDTSSSNYAVTVAGDWKNYGGVFAERAGTVTLDGTSQAIPSSETFYNLTKAVASADTLTFGSGSTTTITATVTLTGASSNLLSLRSSIDAQQWKIDPQSTRTLAYLDVKDSNNINASPIMAGGLNITDSGNLTNWIFDDVAPGISAVSPGNGSVGASRTPTLILTLDEAVTAVAAKNITIKKASDNSTVETIAASGALVEVSGAVVTIRPSVTLAASATYYVLIDSGAFEDDADNGFAGIAAGTGWSFATADASDDDSSSSANNGSGSGGGGGYRGATGPGGRSNRAEIARAALVDRFKTQVASDETTVPPKGGSASSRSARPTVVKGSASSAGQTAQASSSGERIVSQNRGHLEVSDGLVAVLYKDVPVDAWFAPFVSFLIEENIAEGYKDDAGKPKGEFGVMNPVTYAELAKMTLEAAGKDLKKAGVPRNASAKGTWASPYIALAETLQLYVYAPSLDVTKTATRGEVIQTILEALGITIGKTKATYADVPADHPYGYAIASATFFGLVEGDRDANGVLSNTFRPDAPINRAEVAKLIAIASKLAEE